MDKLIYKQFKLVRGNFIKKLEGISSQNIDIQPVGFNNTIHWHIGHVLTVTEQFMFGFPKKSAHLPEHYRDIFGNGTKPADWGEDIPTVEQLLVQLQDQLGRLMDIPVERFDEMLKQPFLGLETFGELASMSVIHESNHLGQIQAMNRLIEQWNTENE